jgi:hypothetical protein
MESGSATEHRLEPRSNIFVAATLYASGGSTPVRIRNMSRNGALIEAAALPRSGTAIRLSRGPLSVAGELIWVTGPKAGLHFSSSIAVADWLPNGNRGSGQQLIDEMVHQSRLGAIPKTGAPIEEPSPARIFATPDELMRLQHMLERAGEELAGDASIAARHVMALQLVDGVAQALAKLAAQAGEGAA